LENSLHLGHNTSKVMMVPSKLCFLSIQVLSNVFLVFH